MADKPNSGQADCLTQQPSIQFDKATQSSSFLLSTASSDFRLFHRRQVHRLTTNPMASNPHHNNRPAAPMGPPASRETKKVDISSLMSPPDPVIDSFSQSPRNSLAARVVASQGQSASAKQPLPMSPPISPYDEPLSSNNEASASSPNRAVKDPVLYPAEESSPSSPPQPPLFAPTELDDHKRIVDDHVRARSSSVIFSGVAPPRREEYELVLTFQSQVMRHFTNNRKGWLRKERALLMADRQAGAKRYHTIAPAKPIAAKPSRSQRADRVSKPQGPAPRPIRTSASGASGTSTAGASRSSVTVRPTGAARPAARRPSATPEPSRRIVAPNREDKDFDALPDYCPPLNSLPNKANSLKVDWKGQPIDLSNDPHRNLLHSDEIILAGNLRLDCATYLTSKRRMFERRLQCLRTGKEFRKTDAQQACKIDVNKASKLWTAFDKVGWLDPEWVRHFL